jgi:hypothetical protein
MRIFMQLSILYKIIFMDTHLLSRGNTVAQWLRRYATNQKVAGSILDEVNF